MITSQPFKEQQLFRALDPRWSHTPLSGSGAAIKGGRFNRKGVEAVYLSIDTQTALAEYQQTSLLLPPATICTYIANTAPLVDLRRLNEENWDSRWQHWTMNWREILFNHHMTPVTWDLGDLVIKAGHPGIIFPSLVHSSKGVNVVLFPDLLTGSNTLDVYDPNKSLPNDQSSWA